jgi:hypothetical protein
MINITANAVTGQEVWAADFSLVPQGCGQVQTDLVLYTNGMEFKLSNA